MTVQVKLSFHKKVLGQGVRDVCHIQPFFCGTHVVILVLAPATNGVIIMERAHLKKYQHHHGHQPQWSDDASGTLYVSGAPELLMVRLSAPNHKAAHYRRRKIT